jgi:hypothetical protein
MRSSKLAFFNNLPSGIKNLLYYAVLILRRKKEEKNGKKMNFAKKLRKNCVFFTFNLVFAQ